VASISYTFTAKPVGTVHVALAELPEPGTAAAEQLEPLPAPTGDSDTLTGALATPSLGVSAVLGHPSSSSVTVIEIVKDGALPPADDTGTLGGEKSVTVAFSGLIV